MKTDLPHLWSAAEWNGTLQSHGHDAWLRNAMIDYSERELLRSVRHGRFRVQTQYVEIGGVRLVLSKHQEQEREVTKQTSYQ